MGASLIEAPAFLERVVFRFVRYEDWQKIVNFISRS
jgi:hypothetical protein